MTTTAATGVMILNQDTFFPPLRLIAPHDRVSTSENRKQIAEDIHIGTTISNGEAEPEFRSIVISVVEIRHSGEVFITVKVTISFVGSSGDGFLLCIFSIAASARGVAAFPSPSILAAILAEISSAPSPELHEDGKNSLRNGLISRESLRIIPDSSNTLMTPPQRHIIPISEKVSVTASDAPSIIALPSSARFPVMSENIKDNRTIIPKVFPSMILFLSM